jgi:putative DNA-invertase from lambdoid prophage Rac
MERYIKRKIFAYCLVRSSEPDMDKIFLEIEQAGYIPDHRFKDVDIDVDVCVSKRPQFKALLAQIRYGETMVLPTLEGLGRDAMEVAKTIKLLAARRIHVIVLQLDQINITSTAGKLLLAMLESLAALDEKFRTRRRRPVSEEDLPGLKRVVRNRKLSEQQRQQVLVRLNTGESIKELARVFGVTRIQIMRINTGSE